MKHLLSLVILLLVISTIIVSSPQAQTLPNSFNYQGRLTDTAGTPLPNGDYQMIFSIWDAATGGNQLWGSGNKTVALNKGLFTASLGPIPATALPAANVFLQVQLGTDTPMPRIALGAVPYALKAVELLWPAVASIANANPVMTLTNTGAGPALAAVNSGTGWAGTFTITNPNNSIAALLAMTNGSGNALHASTSGSRNAVYGNTSGGGSGVYGTTSSTGNGVYGLATAGGTAGKFETTGTTDRTTLIVKNQANGPAAYFDSVAGAGSTLSVNTTASGAAGEFSIVRPSSTSPSVWAKTTGSGPAIKATPGSGLAGLFEGILQANTLKIPTGAVEGYVLGGDAAGVTSWRRDGLTLPYSTIATTAEDTFSLLNRGTGKTMWLGIDNANSTSPTLHITGNHKGPGLLVDGQAKIGGFKMATGASNGYVLTSDANGLGSWKATGNQFSSLSASYTISTLDLTVDPNNTNTGYFNGGVISFGAGSGEGIYSRRQPGINQYGLEFVTNYHTRIAINREGYVGIGMMEPSYKFHVKGAQTGGYSTPLSYIENTNTSGNSAPALRLGGSGNSADGVLNISNFGTGKIIAFGGTGGEVANIDVDGNLSAKNLAAVACVEHNNKVFWNGGDTKFLESLPVKAPSNGYYVVDAYVTGGANTTASEKAVFELILYDATVSNNKVFLKRTLYSQDGLVRIEQDVAIRGVYPATKGQSKTFQLEGHYFDGSRDYFYWTDSTSLRVQFVPNLLAP